MDYAKYAEEALRQYPFRDPVAEFIRHNENMTYKVTERGSGDSYLLRIYRPITTNMQGLQTTREAIQSELECLVAWSSHSEFPVQLPVLNRKAERVTTIAIGDEDVHCSILSWIAGEMMKKQDLDNAAAVNAFGSHIADLHQFSQGFRHRSSFKRPEYGTEWTAIMLSQLRASHETGVIEAKELCALEDTFSLVDARMQAWGQTAKVWGFIHADINYSNVIRTSKGSSFIDFSLSGFGHYAMDVAIGALMVKSELRDDLLSGYTKVMKQKMDTAQLESYMFLAVIGYYAFLVSQQDKHGWIRDNMLGFVARFCEPLLEGRPFFYTV